MPPVWSQISPRHSSIRTSMTGRWDDMSSSTHISPIRLLQTKWGKGVQKLSRLSESTFYCAESESADWNAGNFKRLTRQWWRRSASSGCLPRLRRRSPSLAYSCRLWSPPSKSAYYDDTTDKHLHLDHNKKKNATLALLAAVAPDLTTVPLFMWRRIQCCPCSPSLSQYVLVSPSVKLFTPPLGSSWQWMWSAFRIVIERVQTFCLELESSLLLTEHEETSILVTLCFRLPRFSSSLPMWS